MHRTVRLLALAFAAALSSCADTADTQARGPVSETSQIPWNAPVAGQGGGQLGMLPQNQYRR